MGSKLVDNSRNALISSLALREEETLLIVTDDSKRSWRKLSMQPADPLALKYCCLSCRTGRNPVRNRQASLLKQ